MPWKHQAKHAEEEVINHLIDRRKFLQDVMTDHQAEHERKPAVHGQPLEFVAHQGNSQGDFEERNERQVRVDDCRRKLNPELALEQAGVVVKKTAGTEKLAGATTA